MKSEMSLGCCLEAQQDLSMNHKEVEESGLQRPELPAQELGVTQDRATVCGRTRRHDKSVDRQTEHTDNHTILTHKIKVR
jgi:hypothetical protein